MRATLVSLASVGTLALGANGVTIESGCAAHSCTLVGCADEAIITLKASSDARASGAYTIELTFDGSTVTCALVVSRSSNPASGTVQGSCSSSSVELSWLEDPACSSSIEASEEAPGDACSPAGQLTVTIAGTPATVGVTVIQNGMTLASSPLDLSYADFKPNGPECAPTCQEGAGTVSLSAL